MKLPGEHITPKLESLPKGLRDKAEAIIKKKFGLRDVETTAHKSMNINAAQRLMNDMANRMVDGMRFETTTARQVNAIRVSECEVEFYPNYCTIDMKCQRCGMGLDYLKITRSMVDQRFRQEATRDCPRCHTRTALVIDAHDLDNMFRRQGMSPSNPMYDMGRIDYPPLF